MNDTFDVLLIEDSSVNGEFMLDALAQARSPIAVHVARSGQEAIDYLLGNGEFADREKHPLPDLILLDLKLPGIDGHQVLQIIKTTPVILRIPTIILTSSGEPDDVNRAYDDHANSYLVKPVSVAETERMVKLIEDYWFSLNVLSP